jgi:hypothetical protein
MQDFRNRMSNVTLNSFEFPACKIFGCRNLATYYVNAAAIGSERLELRVIKVAALNM